MLGKRLSEKAYTDCTVAYCTVHTVLYRAVHTVPCCMEVWNLQYNMCGSDIHLPCRSVWRGEGKVMCFPRVVRCPIRGLDYTTVGRLPVHSLSIGGRPECAKGASAPTCYGMYVHSLSEKGKQNTEERSKEVNGEAVQEARQCLEARCLQATSASSRLGRKDARASCERNDVARRVFPYLGTQTYPTRSAQRPRFGGGEEKRSTGRDGWEARVRWDP